MNEAEAVLLQHLRDS